MLLELNEKYNLQDQLENNNNINNINSKHIFAPYLYTGSENIINLKDVYNKTSCKNYFISFLNDNNGIPSWSNNIPYYNNHLKEEIQFIQEHGGNIIISTGGAGGKELIKSYSPDECFKYITYFIDNYNIKWFDFDIEGSDISNNEHINKRIQLIKKLKLKYPDIFISFTLPVSPDGFHNEALNLIKRTLYNTTIDCINLMTMDFGIYYAPNGSTEMAKYCIQCIESVHEQLHDLTDKNIKIGCTPMIGVNDLTDEIFNLSNANELINYCINSDKVYLLSFWCINRDNGNNINQSYADSKYSGIKQNLYEFTTIFNKFNN